MQRHSFRGCVVIPSYNSGTRLLSTVQSVLSVAGPVVVSIDGSTDGSDRALAELSRRALSLHVLRSTHNRGKGAAALHAFEFASSLGCTHAAVFDSDGQHDPGDIPLFLEAARADPGAMILGLPVFGTDAPRIRRWGRKVGNLLTDIETLWGGIGDSLFGFRVYPLKTSIGILKKTQGALGFDFDTQLSVRLFWEGVRPVNIPTRVVYPSKAEGGVSHFRYLRHNLLLARAHAALLRGALWRLPRLLRARFGALPLARRSAGDEPQPRNAPSVSVRI